MSICLWGCLSMLSGSFTLVLGIFPGGALPQVSSQA